MVLIGAAFKSVLKYLSKTRAGGVVEEDKKWSVHYTTQKPQQGLVFHPGSRRTSGSVDNLQGCDRLTQHGYGSLQLHLQSPASLSCLDQSQSSVHRGRKDKGRKKSSASSEEDERFFFATRPMTPLVLNPVDLTSCCDVITPAYDDPTVAVETDWVPPLRLPTPEERMRQQAEAVGADIVAINITGESFERQASFRRSVANGDTLSRRPRNLSRRQTVTGIPDDISRKLDSPLVSLVLPGQFSTVGRPASSCTSSLLRASSRQQEHREEEEKKKREEEVEEERRRMRQEEEEEVERRGVRKARRIRAQRGEGISSLMASLTSSSPRSSSCCSSSSEFHSLPHPDTDSSLHSDASYSSASYRTLSASSSCCQSQDLQGFPSDLQPLLPFDPTARVTPQSPLSSPSSPLTGTPGSEWSYPSETPLSEATCPSSSHYLSSSSITDSESQFSYQALDDQTPTLQDAQGSYSGAQSPCTGPGESWSYQPLSPSSSILSSQTAGDWSGVTQETSSVSGEGWSCDTLLSSSRSSPCHTDCNSLCSEEMASSPSPNMERRLKSGSSSSSHLHTITRSISLRKSKRPPPPPLRCDSLRRRPGRGKPPRPSSSPRLERRTQQTPPPAPQGFQDPWVPRSHAKRRQSGVICGTVTTFEPLSPGHQAMAAVDPPHNELPHLPQLPPSPAHIRLLPPAPPGSGDEGLSLALDPQPATSSPAGLQRLASPSSGYSSQSNTPTPGTPVSSPLTPSSPLTASPGAFSLPPASPFSSSCSSSSSSFPLSASSLPRTRPKPPVPERKSSLFSSLSSSFSSTSSLSSCTSSESSAKHPLLPPLPHPPPLPECTSPYPPVFSPVHESPPTPPLHQPFLPPPPPPPPPSLPPPPPPPPSLPPPPPLPPPPSLPPPPPLPPPPSLPPPSSQTPPPPPPLHSRPPPPPYSYAVKQSSHHPLLSTMISSISLPRPPSPPPSELPELPINDLPPPPPLPSCPASSLPPPGLVKSPNLLVKLATPPCPLVTAQALQAVKLRSIMDQEDVLTSITLTSATSTKANLHSLAHSDAKLAGTMSANANYNLASNEAHTDSVMLVNANLHSLGSTDAKLAGIMSANDLASNGAKVASAALANANLHNLDNTDAKQHGIMSANANYNLASIEVKTTGDTAADTNLQSPGSAAASQANQGNSGTQLSNDATLQDVQRKKYEIDDSDIYATLTNHLSSSPDTPQVKMFPGTDVNYINANTPLPPQQTTDGMLADAKPTETAEKQGNTEDVWQIDSPYWTFSGNGETDRESKESPACYTILSESKDQTETNEKMNVQNCNATDGKGCSTPDNTAHIELKECNSVSAVEPGSPGKTRSLERPIPPNKPDLGVLGLSGSPEAKQGPGRKSGGRITASFTNLISQTEPPVDPVSHTPWSTHSARGTPSQSHTTHTPTNTMTHTPVDPTVHSAVETTAHTPVNTTIQTPFDATTHAPADTTRTLAHTTTYTPVSTITHTPFKVTMHTPVKLMTHTPVNTTYTPASSPQRQKPPILHKKPDLSLILTRATKPDVTSKHPEEVTGGTLGTTSNFETCGIMETLDPLGTLDTLRTLDTLGTTGNSGITGTLRTCSTSGIMGTLGTCSTLGTLDTSGTTGALGTWGTSGTLDTTGTTGTFRITGTLGTWGTLGVCSTSGTLDTLETTGTLDTSGTMGTLETLDTAGTMGTLETSSTSGTLDTTGTLDTSGTLGTLGTLDTLGTCSTLGISDTHRASHHLWAMEPKGAGKTELQWDEEKTIHRRVMRSSLAEDEEEEEKDEKERVEERAMKMMMMMMSSTTKKKDKARKRRKRKAGRQLMMMSSVMEPSSSSSTSSSSSSSSSSSGDEQDVEKERKGTRERVRMMRVGDEDSSECDCSCDLIGQSRYSLSSALSTDSLRGELSLPDLLIQEPEEEEGERKKEEGEERREESEEAKGSLDADLFISVSADQMFVSSQPRTTEDLFAVIHRSKRKMLGRRDSEDERQHNSSSSSSSPPLTPTAPLPGPQRPPALRGQRSGSSESFKALLLRKGSRSDSSCRISAVERLRSAAAGPQRAPPPPDRPELEPAHLPPDEPVTPCGQSFSLVFGWRPKELPQNHLFFTSSSSSSSFFFLSSSLRPPRSLTPPCSASRRFAARCRLPASPMTAIFEGEGEEEEEEEEEEDVFVESGLAGESSQRLVEIS